MAATMSPWSKPGAWALDSEENEAELLQPLPSLKGEPAAASDFPSLAAAASTKPSKKKKAQTLSLAEFSTGHSVAPGSARSASATASKGLTQAEMQALPTGPRERTAEELDRSRLGGGFRGFDSGRGGGGGGGRYSSRDDSPNSRWGSSRVSDEKSAPSRADEIDDWAAAKKSSFGNGFERRDREKGAFFDSHSRADESDSWMSKKGPVPPSSEGRRYGSSSFAGGFDRESRRGGFDSGNGSSSDSDFWGKKKEEGIGNGGGADLGFWGKKREEGIGNVSGGGGGAGRPRLNLQPRTLPLSNNQPQEPVVVAVAVAKPKGSNPFGEARPREEVLAQKGQDWKKIDEHLESVKIKEGSVAEDIAFGKKNFGSENGRGSFHDDRTEKSWRKPISVGSCPSSPEKVENNSVVSEN